MAPCFGVAGNLQLSLGCLAFSSAFSAWSQEGQRSEGPQQPSHTQRFAARTPTRVGSAGRIQASAEGGCTQTGHNSEGQPHSPHLLMELSISFHHACREQTPAAGAAPGFCPSRNALSLPVSLPWAPVSGDPVCTPPCFKTEGLVRRTAGSSSMGSCLRPDQHSDSLDPTSQWNSLRL